MPHNIELKARVHSLAEITRAAAAIATSDLGILVQTDTYYHCRSGRLKLREFADRAAELIAYQRSDDAVARECSYHRVEVASPAELRVALAETLGVRAVVRKRRRLFLCENVRIHLDEVEQLGEFVELEAAVSPAVPPTACRLKLNEIMGLLGIAPPDLLPNSYSEMLSC